MNFTFEIKLKEKIFDILLDIGNMAREKNFACNGTKHIFFEYIILANIYKFEIYGATNPPP
jgi:hypothetical protein